MARVQQSSNPVFTSRAAQERSRSTPTAADLQRMYDGDRLSVSDVIVHTAGLLVLLVVFAGVGWAASPDGAVPAAAVGAALVALGLGFAISLMRRVHPVLVIAYTALEGVFVGGVSHAYSERSSGIVGQALLGTAVIFAVMLGLHTSGKLRATPRMQRVVTGGLMGVVLLSLIDLLLRVTGIGHVPLLNSPSPLGVLISLAILVLASLQFTLDFSYVESAVNAGAPRSEAWRLGFGLVVSFVWVYLELLRLLSRITQR